jgi:predicted metalloendopeptidase
MVEDIKAAMRARIERLDWMSGPTRERALRKLDAMTLKIGYPDRWKTFDGLVIARDDYAGNWLRANAHDFGWRLADLGRPVDRARWFTSPHLVNAFAGSLNEIVFPAAILQPPFYDVRADDAVNFGGIGAVIGHEITHHFDDRGRQFDDVGNLADWWTAADADAYRKRAALVAEQFSAFAPLPGETINGEQTLGENISDLGGVNIAYDGLQRALARKPARLIEGLTSAQRFYISYATIWRAKHRTEALLDALRTGQHSPARYRVLGPLANVPSFAQAFDCPPDAPMLRPPGKQISIW